MEQLESIKFKMISTIGLVLLSIFVLQPKSLGGDSPLANVACSPSVSIVSTECHDNNTATTSDDEYDVTINVTNPMPGPSGFYQVKDGSGITVASGTYGANKTLYGFDYGTGPHNYTIVDADDPGCTTGLTITDPGAPCSPGYTLSANFSDAGCSAGCVNVTVSVTNSNGETWEIRIKPAGGGASYSVYSASGNATTTVCIPFSDTNGPPDYTGATLWVAYVDWIDAPIDYANGPCMGSSCSLDAPGLSGSQCNDNGTPTNPNDDYITFSLNPSGSGLSSGYSVSSSFGSVSPSGGTYGSSTFFTLDPGSANGSTITITITDNGDANCSITTTVSENPCSNQCILTGMVNQGPCNDNGTPTNPNDDYYELTFSATSQGGSGTYIFYLDGVNQGTYAYGGGGTIQVPADGNFYSYTFEDSGNSSCTDSGTLPGVNSCSNASCTLIGNASKGACNDNGTPGNPNDDYYIVTFSATAQYPGSSNSYDVYLDGSTFIGTFSYGSGGTFQVPADGVPHTLDFEDVDISSCTDVVNLSATQPCSAGQCSITASYNAGACNDNGTPGNSNDDYYIVSFSATATNGGSSGTYRVYLDGNFVGTYLYGTGGSVQVPADATGHDLDFEDSDDPTCSDYAFLSAVSPCSAGQCSISGSYNSGLCNDNGTPANPNDDYYVVTYSATATNGGSSNLYYVLLDGSFVGIHNYGSGGSVQVPADGSSHTLDFIDNDIASCIDTKNLTAVSSCSSGGCSLQPTVNQGPCNDNGTPLNAGDDYFVTTFTVTSTNGSASNQYTATLDGLNIGTYTYGTSYTVNVDADNATHLLVFRDVDDNTCTASEILGPVAPCSVPPNCSLNGQYTQGPCDDNGTTSLLDDYYVLSFSATNSTSLGNTYEVYLDGFLIGTYTYGSGSTVNVPADNNTHVIVFVDVVDDQCTDSATLPAVAPCSVQCNLTGGGLTNIECLDNGTPSDPTDDRIRFQLNPTGTGLSSQGYNVSVSSGSISPSMGTYGGPTTFVLNPGSAGGGNVVVTIEDKTAGSACDLDVTIQDPGPCSDLCIMDIVAMTTECNDNGTSDPSDDYFTVDVTANIVNGGNTYEVVYNGTVLNPGGTTSGNTVTVGINGEFSADGSSTYTLMVRDANDNTCNATQDIGPVIPCSLPCGLCSDLTTVICNDNNTPTDPTDDFFTVQLVAINTNPSAAGTYEVYYNGTLLETANYGDPVVIGDEVGVTFPADGSTIINFEIIDGGDPTCTLSNSAGPVDPCSGSCQMPVNQICELTNDSYTLNAEAGLSNVIWYNGDDVQIGTGSSITINAQSTGLQDGWETFYYTATDADGCPAQVCCPVLFVLDCPCEDRFDLALTKTINTVATPGPYAPGDQVTFNITVINQGNLDAYNVQVTDYIPTGLTLDDANWFISTAGKAQLVTPIAFIQANAQVTVQVSFLIDNSFTGNSLINWAEISSADDDQNPGNTPPVDFDSTPDDINFNQPGETNDLNDDNVVNENGKLGGDEDDHDPAEVIINANFDLALRKIVNTSATPGPYAPGDQVTFTIQVFNQGTLDAYSVQVTDYIPSGLVLSDAAWTTPSGGKTSLVTPIAFIGAGQSTSRDITFTIDPNFQGSMLRNWAEISSADDDQNPSNTPPVDFDSTPDDINFNQPGETDDLDDDNVITQNGKQGGDEDDHDPSEITIGQVFDLALRKVLNVSATPGPFLPGDAVTFTIEVHNQGTVDATNIQLVDYIPSGLILNDVDWTVGAGNMATYNTPFNLAAGTMTSVDISFMIDAGFTGSELVNFAEIKSASNSLSINDIDSSPDMNPGNDSGGDPETATDDEIDQIPPVDEDDHDPALIRVVRITHNKSLSSITQLPNGTFNVVYTINVINTGSGAGSYDLLDQPTFDDDLSINSASFSSNVPSSGSLPLPVPGGGWVLANGTSLNGGSTHTYTLTVNVSLDLGDGQGDDSYTACGETTGTGPSAGEGAFNESYLDLNDDGQYEEIDTACGDFPVIEIVKEFVNITQTDARRWDVKYNIYVDNIGGTLGTYDLYDRQDFEDDIIIEDITAMTCSGSNIPVSLPMPLNGWQLANNKSIGPGAQDCYMVVFSVYMDLGDPLTPGDGSYQACGEEVPGTPQEEEGLFNEAWIDINEDQLPDDRDTACADLPYITHEKDIVDVSQVAARTWDVTYEIKVSNTGGLEGTYDLWDRRFFEDDIVFISASYTTDAPGNPGGTLSSSPTWYLAGNQNIDAGAVHTYTIVVRVSMDLMDPQTPGDANYDACSTNALNIPIEGEGLFNRSYLDLNDDGVEDEIDEACGDLPYITHEKSLVGVVQLANGTFRVTYRIDVRNDGGASGVYTLTDEPQFDDDVSILNALYTSSVVTGGNLPVPPPGGIWTLNSNQMIAPNVTHTYNLEVVVSLDLNPSGGGDNEYTECGSQTGGMPMAGEGLFNETHLDLNDDGISDEDDEACGDLPVIKLEKTLTDLYQNPDDTYWVEYSIRVWNEGYIDGFYDLYDLPEFDEDIVLLEANYQSTVHIPTALTLPPPAAGWLLGDNLVLSPNDVHIYTLRIKLEMDLNDPNTPGDGDYTACGEGTQGVDQPGQGLFNGADLDLNNDGEPDLEDEDCGDIPFVTHEKRFSAAFRNNDGTYTVRYLISVTNKGGAQGHYDLRDIPDFEDDFVINQVSYVTNVPGNPSGQLPLPVPTNGWLLADDQYIAPAVVHNYLITFNVSINLSDPDTPGDEIYNWCGTGNPDGPQGGEGLFNESWLDRSLDGNEEERDTVCRDIEIVDLALRKTLETPGPYAYEQTINFNIEVHNQGNIAMTDVLVRDYLPDGYVLGTPALGWTQVGANLEYTYTGVIQPHTSVDIPLNLVIKMTDGGEKDWINYAEIAQMFDENGEDRSADDVDSYPGSDRSHERDVEPGDPYDDVITGDYKYGNPPGDEDDHDPAGIEIFDLAIRKTIDNPQSVWRYGDEVIFKFEVFNQGSMIATKVVVYDTIPCGYAYDPADNPGWSHNGITGESSITLSGQINPGDSRIIYMRVKAAPCLEGDLNDAWTNITEIKSAADEFGADQEDFDGVFDMISDNDTGGEPGTPSDDEIDEMPPGDEDNHDPAIIRVIDLALRKVTVTQPTYRYGDLIEFGIEVHNQGNVPLTNIKIGDYIPVGYSFQSSANPGWTLNGDQAEYTITDVVYPGEINVITINLRLEMTDGGYTDWDNYAEILSMEDEDGNDVSMDDADSMPGTDTDEERAVHPGDDADNDVTSNDKGGEEDDHDPAGIKVYDLAHRKLTANQTGPYEYGDIVTFTLEVYNQGNIASSNIELTDYIPCGFEYVASNNGLGWTYDPASGNATIIVPGVLEPGESTSVSLSLRLQQCLDTDENTFTNFSEISDSQSEDPDVPNPEDIDSMTDDDPDNDMGGTPDDPNEDDVITGDKYQGEDEDDHDPERVEIFDLAQIKILNTTTTPYRYGDELHFTIEVHNQGNVIAQNIEITDYLPSGYSLSSNPANAIWSVNGANYTTTISGPLAPDTQTSVDIYLIIEQTDGGEKDWINYTEITGSMDDNGTPREDADSNEGSNGAEEQAVEPGDAADDDLESTDKGGEEDDHDPAGIELFDLALRKQLVSAGPHRYSDELTFSITVFNQGSMVARNIDVVDYIPEGYSWVNSAANAAWTYNASTGMASTRIAGPLNPGGSLQLYITLRLEQAYTETAWDNYAEIKRAEDEAGNDMSMEDADSMFDMIDDNDTGGQPNTSDDDNIDGDKYQGEDEDDHDPERPEIIDLAAKKWVMNKRPWYAPGEIVPFTITLYNQGNVDVTNIGVNDYMPQGYLFDPSIPQNAGWVLNGSTVEYTYTGVLAAQDSVNLSLYLIVQIAQNPTLDDWINYTEIASVQDTQGNDRSMDDADSMPDTDADHERAVEPGGPDDNNIFGDYKNKGEDEDDHDPEEVEVTGALGDTVWNDLDGDGIQDPGEPGVPNVIATLYKCDGTFVRRDTTDANGFYFFDFLIPLMEYYVVFDISAYTPDYAFTTQDQGVNDSLDSDVNLAGVGPCTYIEPGERDSTYDAGIVELSTLGDMVWEDMDGDGIMDFGEPGVPGVIVTLYDFMTGAVVRVDTTDANGKYLFEYLRPGMYYIGFDYPDVYELTYTNAGTNDALDSDVGDFNGPNTTEKITVPPGTDDRTWDLGLYRCVEFGDFVWFDLNANGIQDGPENGINGVRVYIYNQNGELVDQTTTGPNPFSASGDGYYHFCVRPGTYYIVFERPGHLAPSAANQTLNEDKDSDITHAVELYSTDYYTVRSGEKRDNIDGGFHHKATMGDRVWFDENGNGIQDGAEPRVAGVRVGAYDAAGTEFWHAYSDQQGEFVMDGLPKGEYYLKFDPPSGYTFTQPDQGGDDGMDSDVDGSNGPRTTALYRLNPGEHEPDVDAGLVQGFLPIELIRFDAKYRGEKVEVRWTTAIELNNDYYEVERRHESETAFRVVGTVKAAGTVYNTQDYGYDDYDVERTGLYYYRLRQVDTDGTDARSEVRVVEVRGGGTGADLYPNPASTEINVSLRTPVEVQSSLVLVDQLGRVLPEYTRRLHLEEGTTVEKMDIENLTPGVYTIRVTIGDDVQRLRFTKM